MPHDNFDYAMCHNLKLYNLWTIVMDGENQNFQKTNSPKNPHNVVLDFDGLMKSNVNMMLPW